MKKQWVLSLVLCVALLLSACAPSAATPAQGAGTATPGATPGATPTQTPVKGWPSPVIDADGTYHFGFGENEFAAKLLTDFTKGKLTLAASYGAYSFEDGVLKAEPNGSFADSYNNYTGPDVTGADYASAAYIGLFVENKLQSDAYFGLQGNREDNKPLLLAEKGSPVLLVSGSGAAYNAEVSYKTYRYCITVPEGFSGYILIPADRFADSDGSGANGEEPVLLWNEEGRPAFSNLGFHVTASGAGSFNIHNLFIGKEELPVAEKNWSEMGIDNPEYSYTEAQRIMPFWKSGVMYNEALAFEETGAGISGNLLFVPTRIISVVDYSLKKEYKAGVDFQWVEGTNKLEWLPGSAIPYFYKGALQGIKEAGGKEKIAAGKWDELGRQLLDGCLYSTSAFLYEKQICVTYEYDRAQIESQSIPLPAYQGEKLPKTTEKLTNNQDVKILFYGASVTSGCDASGMYGRAPNMPGMSQLMKDFIATQTTGKVTVSNFAFGGSTVQQQIDALKGTVDFNGTPYNYQGKFAGYDLLVLAGITNDLDKPASYVCEKVKELVALLRTQSPNLEVLIYTSVVSNPEAKNFYTPKPAQVAAIISLALEEGYTLADTYALGERIMQKKLYSSVTGNNINHPNDWLIRLNAQYLLATLFDMDKLYK